MRTTAGIPSLEWIAHTRMWVVATAIWFIAALGAVGAGAQISLGPPILSLPDNVQTVSGMCSDYQNTLSMPGVTAPDGTTHPNDCRFADLVPLFNGHTLATLPGTPSLYRSTRPTIGRGGTCVTETSMQLTLSAQVQVSRLNWTNGPTSGRACSNEWMRVDPASTANAGPLLSRANRIVAKAIFELRRAPNITACTYSTSRGAAAAALDVKVRARLQALANQEQLEWKPWERTLDSPGVGAATICRPQCGVCAPAGWAGQIKCVKTATGTNYHHTETQMWFVGGATPLPTGQTLYPTQWTSTGSGGNATESWTVDASGTGQLGVFTNQAGLNFQRTNAEIEVHNAIHGNPTSYDDYEYQFLPFGAPAGTNPVVNSRTDPPQLCDTPRGASSCSVTCSWDLSLQ